MPSFNNNTLRPGIYLIKNVHSDRYIISNTSGVVETKSYSSEHVPDEAKIGVTIDEDRLISFSSTAGDADKYITDEQENTNGFRHAVWTVEDSKWEVAGNGKPGQYTIKLASFSLFAKQKANQDAVEYEPVILTSAHTQTQEAWMFVSAE